MTKSTLLWNIIMYIVVEIITLIHVDYSPLALHGVMEINISKESLHEVPIFYVLAREVVSYKNKHPTFYQFICIHCIDIHSIIFQVHWQHLCISVFFLSKPKAIKRIIFKINCDFYWFLFLSSYDGVHHVFGTWVAKLTLVLIELMNKVKGLVYYMMVFINKGACHWP